MLGCGNIARHSRTAEADRIGYVGLRLPSQTTSSIVPNTQSLLLVEHQVRTACGPLTKPVLLGHLRLLQVPSRVPSVCSHLTLCAVLGQSLKCGHSVQSLDRVSSVDTPDFHQWTVLSGVPQPCRCPEVSQAPAKPTGMGMAGLLIG